MKKTSTPDSGGIQPRRRRRRAVQYVLVVAGCIVLVQGLIGEKGLLTMLEVRQQYRALEASLLASKSENAILREEARRLKEDPSAIEELARRELGLIKPGEKLFYVRDAVPPDKR